MLLDREVFWIRDQVFFIAPIISALVIFIITRMVKISSRFFLIPDAAGPGILDGQVDINSDSGFNTYLGIGYHYNDH